MSWAAAMPRARARTVHLAVGRISQGFEKETGTHVHVLVAGTYRE
jgi:hypothetical protein